MKSRAEALADELLGGGQWITALTRNKNTMVRVAGFRSRNGLLAAIRRRFPEQKPRWKRLPECLKPERLEAARRRKERKAK